MTRESLKIGNYTEEEIFQYMTDEEGSMLGRSMYDAIFNTIHALITEKNQLKKDNETLQKHYRTAEKLQRELEETIKEAIEKLNLLMLDLKINEKAEEQEGKNYFSERAYSCSCCLSKAAFICWNACSSLAKSDISRPITVTVIAKHTARNINAAISHHSHSNTNKTTTSQLTIRVPMNKTSDLTSSTSLWKLILTSVNCCVNLRKSFRALVFIYLITYASPVVAFHDALCIINTKGKACAYAKSRYQGKREQFLLETHGHSTASEYTVMVSSTPSALVAVEFAAEWGFVRRGMGLTSFLRLTS